MVSIITHAKYITLNTVLCILDFEIVALTKTTQLKWNNDLLYFHSNYTICYKESHASQDLVVHRQGTKSNQILIYKTIE